MTSARALARLGLGGLLAGETMAAWSRWEQRRALFQQASQHAKAVGRPLAVVLPDDESAFDRSMHLLEFGPGAARILDGTTATLVRTSALARGAPLPDDSAVVYVACVLEYLDDVQTAMDAMLRIAGSPEHLYIITVQPWTLTAALYPGARWTGISATHVASMAPVSALHKGVAGGILASLAAVALWPQERQEMPPSPTTEPAGPPLPWKKPPG